MTTYSVSVTSHIPKKEGTCLLENTLGIFIHTGNRKPRKPQSRKRSLVSGCCQCFTPENEVTQSWANRCTSGHRSDADLGDNQVSHHKRFQSKTRNQRRERSFWTTFGAITDYMNILKPWWRWLAVSLGLSWKGSKKKQRWV